MGKKAFRKTLDWVGQVGRLFDIGANATHMSVVQFGETIRTETSFKDEQVLY